VFRGGDRVFERKGASPHCHFNHLRLSSCPPQGRQINKWQGKEEIRKDRGGTVSWREIIKGKRKRMK